MIGPCTCGDTHCSSCGPAQGNWKCPICHVWVDDGCEHINDDLQIKPEFIAQAEEIARSEAEADEAYARELQRMDELWKEQE